jgi:hypothetical protein
MTRLLGAALAIALVSNLAGVARADDKADTILDKAIKALGGQEKLDKADAISVSSKGTARFQGNESDVTWKSTVKGTDHMRNELKSDQFNAIFVLAGDKGWGKFGDETREMEGGFLANQKRNLAMQLVPMRPVVLKGKGFKYEAVGEQQVGGKPASGLKVTDPDGKDFTLYFDNETGLPVLLKAKITGFNGEEFDQETTYADYKDFDGIKKATKVETKRNGELFSNQTVTDFKVLDKVDPETFTEPK